ncbi:MAG: D-alanine--D-alanine ligase [Chloroflexi bacterium]|nr:D-alanine--D-alanine ligase [Chloroflexota bacterium]
MAQQVSYRVGVLFGGRSSEHAVSLASARTVMHALRQAGHEVIPIGISRTGQWLLQPDGWLRLAAGEPRPLPHDETAQSRWEPPTLPPLDVIFPVLHGPYGEDGTVQGLLEMAGLPYVGSGVLASAAAMDKAIARRLFASDGLPQVRYRVVRQQEWQAAPTTAVQRIEQELSYPLFLKPANMGSSVGVSKVVSRAQLEPAMSTALRYDRKVLVEEAVPAAREIEVSVLGNEQPAASVAGEIVPANEFYDYNAKYESAGSQLLIPARLKESEQQQLQRYAVRAFQTLECEGLARVDFLLDGQSGHIYLNEVNTLPGFTQISMYPKLWEASGLSCAMLVHRLLELAMERFQARQALSTGR